MISTVHSFGVRGIRGFMTQVETYITRGIPEFEIIGLGDASVKESKRRVLAALRNQGYEIPSGRITVNLAPSCVKKEGTSFDIAIAVCLLCASNLYSQAQLNPYAFIGELSLDGSVRPVNGVVAMLVEGHKQGISNFIVPSGNVLEGAHIRGMHIYGIDNLRQIHQVLDRAIQPVSVQQLPPIPENDLCFSQVIGQAHAKRALEIAAAGGHHILMMGSAGSGKTMLAKRFTGILPPLTDEEMYEVAAIHSVSALRPSKDWLYRRRPFRMIQADITKAGLIGGRIPITPGEVSLAHHGVLFWDEMAESDRSALDALRVPLEAGEVRLSRLGQEAIFPAKFQLIGAANPCRCGKMFENDGTCTCTPLQIQRYRANISKPLLDRIDLQVSVRNLPESEIQENHFTGETSDEIRTRVLAVRELQKQRYQRERILLNAGLTRNMIEKYCCLSVSAKKLLTASIRRFGLSMRTYEKMIQVARTIADLNHHTMIEEADIAEAFQYRLMEA